MNCEAQQYPNVAVLVPCYKRPEYTAMCIDALFERTRYPHVLFVLVDDGSKDNTPCLLNAMKARYQGTGTGTGRGADAVWKHTENYGLHATVVEFWRFVKDHGEIDIAGKIDYAIEVFGGWLTRMVEIFDACPELMILSPTTREAKEAEMFGVDVGQPYMQATNLGGLWVMRRSVIEGLNFDAFGGGVKGVHGSWPFIQHLRNRHVTGWAPDVVVEHVGDFSGSHPLHIKTQSHADYSQEVGRGVAWDVDEMLSGETQ